MAIHLKSQHITNMFTPIELITTGLQGVNIGGFGGGVTDHGYLHGLEDNDHPQYMMTSGSSVYVQSSNMTVYQLIMNSSLSLGVDAANSFINVTDSSLFLANSQSVVFALTNHTHGISAFGGAASDHSHGSVNIVSTAGTQLTAASASTGLTLAVPNYITTAYGIAVKGSGTYTQNTGTIQFANSNGLSFGLSDNGVMTAIMAYASQVGILGISDGINSIQTNSSIKFADSNGISFRLNGSTMTASYTVPGTTRFSNSNNVEFGLSGSTITALALFSQSLQTENRFNLTLSGNTTGTMAFVSSGIMTLGAGTNITLSQNGNAITILGPNPGGSTHYVNMIGNTAGTTANISSGTFSLAGGNNITLSQSGNAITISGANIGGAQTGISGIGASNATYTSGSVYVSGQNNITVGSYVSSNSQYIRLSVGDYLTTAANSTHTHGSGPFTVSTVGTNLQFTSISNGLTIAMPNYITTAATGSFAGLGFSSVSTSGTDIAGTLNTNGLNLAIPKYITTAANLTHTHGTPTLSLSLLTGSISSASNGVSLSITGPVVSNLLNVSQVGTLYFSNVPGFSWSSSVNGVSTSVYIVT
jgi:hypothetical protein